MSGSRNRDLASSLREHRQPATTRVLTFRRLKYLSFAHSAIYLTLLVVWIVPGLAGLEQVFGWAHGIGWIVMSLLVIAALRMRIIPLWLAVTVAVVGAVGPFAGSAGFVVEDRRREQGKRGKVGRT